MSRRGLLVVVGIFVMFMFLGQILDQQQIFALPEGSLDAGPSSNRPESDVKESFVRSQVEPSDTIIWETVGNPSTLDPHRCYEGFGNWISENVYETLFAYPFDSPDTSTLIPLLAESVDISPDGLDYTFTLRQGVTFHDGTPFNASCVKDNFERLLKIFDTNGPAWIIAERLLGGQAVEDAAFTFGPGSQEHIDAYDAWTEMGSILVLGEYVVKMRLAAPYAGFLQCLAYQEAAMISPTWFEAHGPVGYGEFNEYVDTHTCGTGPYTVNEWVVGDHITLTKNPDYWREFLALQTCPEAGSIHTVVIRTVEDFEERKLNMLSGQSDGCHWPKANALEIWDPVGGQSLDPDISVWTGEPSYTIMALAINLHDQYNLSGVFVENPFASKDLREACSYAFDYASFIDSAWQGMAVRGQGPLPIGMFGHDDNLFMYDLDLQLAVDAWNRAMESGLDAALAESSYCLKLYYTVRDEATRVIREESLLLFKAGIEAILAHPGAVQPSQPLDIQVFELELADYLAYRRYESHLVMLVGWAPDYADPDNYLFPFCHSQGVYPWWIGYGDSQVDEWIDSSRGEPDAVIRLQQIHQVQQAVVDAAAYIWLGQPSSFEVMRADVQGYSYNPMRYQSPSYNGGGAYFYHMWLIGRSLEPEPSSDTIVWETTGTPDTLDPHRNYGAFGIGITNNVYETLFTYAFDSADTSTLVPLLAESVDISSDGCNYTVTLREGVTFHDGTPFNASCVKYNLERVMKIFDPAGPAWELGETLLGAISVQNAVFSHGQGSQEHIDAYEAWAAAEPIVVLGTYVVRIRLEQPFTPFLNVLAFPVCSMMSPTWVERYGGVLHGQSSAFVDARTCGTGPYCVTECLYNDHITLTRNPDYWRNSEVHALKPNAGSIQTVVLWNNDDAASREERLLSGRIDGCFWPRDDALKIWDPVTRQSLDPDVNVWTEDLTYTMFALGFNMREYIQSFGVMRQNPFYSRDFRVACSYAFDYALFIDDTFNGLAVRGQGPIPAGMYGHDDSLFMYEHNIQLAVEFWNQAMASGLDSVLADNSYELNLYYYPGSALQLQTLAIFKAGLDAIVAHEDAAQPSQELAIQTIGLDWSEYDSLRRGGHLPVMLTGWAPDYADPDNYIQPFCSSPGPWAGWIGYDNSQVNLWFEDSRREMDSEVRLEMINQIQNAVVEDVVYIWLGQLASFHLEQRSLRGYVYNPMRNINGFNDYDLPYFYDYWRDAEPPETTVTGPPDGATVSESSTYHIESSDLSGVSRTEIYLDGELVLETAAAIVDYTLEPILVDDGEHILTIRVYDNFDQEQVTEYVVFTDTTPPESPETFTTTNVISYWAPDNPVYVEWSGATDDGSGIHGYGYAWDRSPTFLPEGTYYTTDTWLSDSPGSGVWYLHVRARDAAGNWAEEALHVGPFKIDTTDPIVFGVVIGPKGLGNWYVDSVTVALYGYDMPVGIDQIMYSYDGVSWLIYEGPFPVESEDAYNIRYYAVDYVGHESQIKGLQFSIDRTPPSAIATVLGAQNPEGTYLGSAVIDIEASDDMSGPNFIEYRLNDGPWHRYEDSFSVGAAGTYTLEYHAVDSAGNVGATGTREFQVESQESGLIELTLTWDTGNIGIVQDLGIGDVDDDGVTEVLTAIEPGYQVTGHVNVYNGVTRVLERKLKLPTGYARTVAIGDPDHDGETEILVGASGWWQTGEIARIYQYNGATGTLEWSSPVYNSFHGLWVVDLDLDGRMEIIALTDYEREGSNIVDGRLLIFDGSTHALELDTGGYGLVLGGKHWLGNMDSDSSLEIVFAGRTSLYRPCDSTIWIVDGATQSVQNSHAVSGYVVTTLTAGDIDLDGDVEIIAGLRHNTDATNYIRVYDANLNEQWQYGLGSNNVPYEVRACNVDSDPQLEIIVGNAYASGSWTGDFFVIDGVTRNLEFTRAATNVGNCIELGDVDDDGHLDLAVGYHAGWSTGRMEVYSTGVPMPSGPSLSLVWSTGNIGIVQDIKIGDVDDDGEVETVLAIESSYGLGHVKIYDGATQTLERTINMPDGYARSLSIGDSDHDGATEIVVGTCGTWGSGAIGRIRVFDGASGTLEWESGQHDGIYTVSVADVDADGNNEIVGIALVERVGSTRVSGTVMIYDGQTQLLEWESSSFGLSLGSYTWIGNIDDDVQMEIVFTGRTAWDPPYVCTLWVVDGLTHQTQASLALGEYDVRSVTAADINLDGEVEVVLGTRESDASQGYVQAYDSDLNPLWTVSLGPLLLPNRVEAANLDQDPELELAVAIQDNHGNWWGHFRIIDGMSHDVLFARSNKNNAPVINTGDLDHDGFLEIAVGYHASFSSGSLEVYDTDVVVSYPATEDTAFTASGSDIYMGDSYVDSDGTIWSAWTYVASYDAMLSYSETFDLMPAPIDISPEADGVVDNDAPFSILRAADGTLWIAYRAGTTWTSERNYVRSYDVTAGLGPRCLVPAAAQSNAECDLVQLSDGTFVMVFSASDSIYSETSWRVYATTSPDMISWSSPVLLTSEWGRECRLTVDNNDRLYAIIDNNHLGMLILTSDDGITWSEPVLATSGHYGDIHYSPAHGRLFLGYCDPADMNIWMKESHDGETWSTPWTAVDRYSSAAGNCRVCEDPDGRFIVTYRDAPDGILNIYARRITLEPEPVLPPALAYEPPSTPILADPGSSVVDGMFTISWGTSISENGPIDYYVLQMSDSASFIHILGEWSDVDTGIYVGEIFAGTYYFRVRAVDVMGAHSFWSNIEDIIVLKDQVPPTVDSPPDFTYEAGDVGRYIEWNPQDTNPANYEIYFDGELIEVSDWIGDSVYITADGLSAGDYSFTLIVYDIYGNYVSDTVFVMVEPATEPLIDSPLDLTYEAGTTGHTITWNPDDLSPNSYVVYLDGAPFVSGDWSGMPISVPVDELDPGVYVFRIEVFDRLGLSATDSVEVTVADTAPPEIPVVDVFHAEAATIGNWGEIWAYDLYPGIYEVFFDSSLVSSGLWDETTPIAFNYDGHDPGEYVYSLYCYDGYNNLLDLQFYVFVVDTTPPTIDHPDDLTYTGGDTGYSITWTPSDPYPDSYEVFVDGSPFESGLWSGGPITIVVDGMNIGPWEFTIVVYDDSANSVTDLVSLFVEGNTPFGEDVTVEDPESGIIFEFEETTTAGWTTVTESEQGPHPPDGFRVMGVYYEIETTVNFEGIITIAFPYDETDVRGLEQNLRIWHWREIGGWEDVTTLVDTENNIIYGEVTDFSSFAVMEDFAPPTTSASLSGTMGRNGWYVSDVTVTLTPEDAVSPILSTVYSYDENTWYDYSTPFVVSEDGYIDVYFYSTDVAGNVEDVQHVDFKVDKTAPVTTLALSPPHYGFDPTFVNLATVFTLDSGDALSDVDRVEYRIDGGNWIVYVEPFTLNEIGSHTVFYRSIDFAGNLEDEKTIWVVVNAVELTYTGDIVGAYSDPVELGARLIEAASRQPIQGKTIVFALGSRTETGITDSGGYATVGILLNQAAGLYTVVASFEPENDFIAASVSQSFTIEKETAHTSYTGSSVVPTTVDTITLRATVFDEDDGYWGDLARAYVTFLIYDVPVDLTSAFITVGPVVVEPTNTNGVGTAVVEIQNLPENGYAVLVKLESSVNSYFEGPNSDFVTITVYEPEGDFVTGGGWIWDSEGNKGNFGFNVKYKRNGLPGGQAIYIFRDGDWEYIIKSNAWLGMAIEGNHAFFEAKCTVQQVNSETGVVIWDEGNYQLRVDVWDGEEEGDVDVFQIRVYDKDGVVWYEAGFDPMGYLEGGTIVIHTDKKK